MVSAMDDAVAEIVQGLKDHGVYNNTIVVFQSDVTNLQFRRHKGKSAF